VALSHVLDASVVIALLDPDDLHHTAAVDLVDVHADETLVLPASAYAETLVRPAQHGQLKQARERIARLGLDVHPIDVAVAEGAATMRARIPALRLPDALVLACADLIDAESVWTADARWAKHSDRVVLLAPPDDRLT
jgi:predicted nucleic acid-binding protein